MNSSVLWIIILGIWVFVLHNKIKDLEEIVEGLLGKDNRKVPTTKTEYSKEKLHIPQHKVSSNETSMKTHLEKAKVAQEIEVPKEEEYISTVSQLRASSPTAKVTTRIVNRKKEAEPAEPSWIMQMLTNYFTGGNLLVRIGGVVLFFGLAFLVKYAAEHTTISMEVRLVFVALFAVSLIILGWKFREKEGAYGQILQGIGVATLYLVIYGAAKFYTILTLDIAFILMFIVVILGSFLSLHQNSLPLALFSTAGGFLAPILTSTGDGSHVMLFSYYFFLNLGIFFMAWKRVWRVLNVIGFLFTFVIATSWGVLRYSPEFFSTTEPFLILYFFMYLTITVLFSRKSEGHLVDGTLLFGLPATVFPLQSYLVSNIEYGAGYSALVMGTVYVLLSKILNKETSSSLLLQSFLGLGLLFFTMAVPYFFDADISASIWAMESAAVIWLSLKQERIYTRYFGELLMFISVGMYVSTVFGKEMTLSIYLGYMIVVIATFTAAYQLQRHSDKLDIDKYLSVIFLTLSFVVWMLSVVGVAQAYEAYSIMHKVLLGFIIGSVLLHIFDRFLKWKLLGIVLQATLPVGMILYLLGISNLGFVLNPFEGLGAIAFFALILWQVYLLYHYDRRWHYANYLHIVSLWFGVAIMSLELRYMSVSNTGDTTMTLLATGVLSLLTVLVLMKGRWKKLIDFKYLPLYRSIGVGGLLGVLGLWEIIAFFTTTDGLYLPYIPIFNILDMMQIAVLYVIYDWVWHHQQIKEWGTPLYLSVVLLISVLFARAMHYYGDIPYTVQGLWSDLYFQLGIAFLWSILVIGSLQRFKQHKLDILRKGSVWLVGGLILWNIQAFSYAPDFLSLYIPLFNILDVVQIIVLGASAYWLYIFKDRFDKPNRNIFYGASALLVGILTSVIFARAVHYYQDVPYMIGALWNNLYFQTGLSILWSVIAIVLMLLSKGFKNRQLWIVGFGLLIVVVLKLFFVELASSGSIERIISFIVVGILLLLIGYFVPMPPENNPTYKDI